MAAVIGDDDEQPRALRRVARNAQLVKNEGTTRDCEFTLDFVRRYGLHTILIGDLTDFFCVLEKG
jgi:hypothetical protein